MNHANSIKGLNHFFPSRGQLSRRRIAARIARTFGPSQTNHAHALIKPPLGALWRLNWIRTLH